MPKESMEKIEPKERKLTRKEEKEWYEKEEQRFLWFKKVLDKPNKRIQKAEEEGDKEALKYPHNIERLYQLWSPKRHTYNFYKNSRRSNTKEGLPGKFVGLPATRNLTRFYESAYPRQN